VPNEIINRYTDYYNKYLFYENEKIEELIAEMLEMELKNYQNVRMMC